ERPQAKPRTNDLEVRRATAILVQRGRPAGARVGPNRTGPRSPSGSSTRPKAEPELARKASQDAPAAAQGAVCLHVPCCPPARRGGRAAPPRLPSASGRVGEPHPGEVPARG